MKTITFTLPGLPGEDGRVSHWHPVEAEYVHGRSLAAYVATALDLEPHQVSHAIILGHVVDPKTQVTIEVRETKWRRRWRKLLRKPIPTVQVSAFDAYIPAPGAEIAIIPNVDGKHAPLILGVVGAIAGIALGPAGWTWSFATLQAAMAGYAIGSAIGSLIVPRPKLIKDQDGPSSYVWGGMQNDDRAGVAKPILVGQRRVGGKRIGCVRRRPFVVPVRTGAGDPDDSSPSASSETIGVLILVAAHRCQGPVGVTTPDAPANATTNKPDVWINGTAYTNYSGLKVAWRDGSPAQTVIPGFDVVANTFDLAVDLTDLGTAYTYTTASAEVDAFEVLLSLPGLSHTDDESGLQKNTTRYRLEYRLQGSPTWINVDYDLQRELSANTRALRTETRRVESLTRGRYEIRVQWLSATYTDTDRDQWHVVLTGITEETQESRNYEGQSLLAVTGLATDQLSGPLPTITSVWRGYIPQPWTTATGFQVAAWGVGSFAPAGLNPYWLALALMRDTKIGAGNEIPDSAIDLPSFEAAAALANTSESVEPADLSTPYAEPRHQFSSYIDQDQEAVDLIQQIIATARGALIFTGNKWRVGVDAPGVISQVFGMGSILRSGEPPDDESTFRLQFKSERHLVNCFEATFDDKEAGWETDAHAEYIDNRDPAAGGGSFVLVDDPEAALIALGVPVLRRKLSYWGVDRRTQVARELRLELKRAYALREFGSFAAATKSMLCEVYDLIGISHDVPQYGYSGRVRESPELTNASLVMFDRAVPFTTGTSYQVMVHFRDPGGDGKDLIETRAVADAAAPSEIQGEYFGLTVTTPFSRVPAENEEWFFGPVDAVVRPVRIIDIDRNEQDARAVSFAEYNASLYDTDGVIRIPNYSLLPDLAAPPGAIAELIAFSEISVRDDGRRVTTVILQWSRPNPVRTDGPYKGARVDYSFDGLNWAPLGSVDGTEYRWEDAPHGILIHFRVVPYSISGKYNHAGAATTTHTPVGYGAPSPVVNNVTGGYADGAFFVAWDALGPEYEYEVRTANPANWTSDTTGFLWRGKATRFLMETPSARALTFYVRALDPFGNYSATAPSPVTVNDTAPAAPTIGAITRFKDGFKIAVTPPGATTDIISIHLHASQAVGFTPSAANRVANVVGPAGGEFFFKTSVAGLWYFKATCSDWLSQRLGDWVYSAEDDDQVVVIQPVNPASVVLTAVPDDVGYTMEPDPIDGTLRPRPLQEVRLTWSFSDVVNPPNSLIGFQIVVFDNVATTDDSPLYDSGLIAAPDRRFYGFRGVPLPSSTYYVAVKAVYVDGLTSDYVASNGAVYPEDENPVLRDSDDRLVPFYAETFSGSVLPIGFTITLSGGYTVSGGVLTITKGSPWGFNIEWKAHTWADAYLDARAPARFANLVFRMRVVGSVTHATGGVDLVVLDNLTGGGNIKIVADGEFHTYSIPVGVIGTLTSYEVNLSPTNPDGIAAGATFEFTTMALAFESVDLADNGDVILGTNARNQFERDPDGDGFYGISPLRIGDVDGNSVVVEANGLFYLRDVAGNLVVETPYKLGRNGKFSSYTHGDRVAFDSVNYGLSTEIPLPTSFNKCRLMIQELATSAVPSDIVANQTMRRWFEAANFEHIGGLPAPGFSIFGTYFYGGTIGSHQVTGPWSQTAESKSALTYSATNLEAGSSDDAWYRVENDAGTPVPVAVLSTPYTFVFRIVVVLSVTMPVSRAANGAYHYCDLDFTIRVGDSDGLNPMSFSFGSSEFGPYRARLLANGLETLIPIVCAVAASGGFGSNRDVKVDFHGRAWETGGSGTPTAAIDSIEWMWANAITNYANMANEEIGFIWLEEFGG